MRVPHSALPHASLSIDIKPGRVSLHVFGNASERRAIVAEFLRSKVQWYSWKPDGSWWYGLQGALGFLVPLIAAVTINLAFPLPSVAAIVVTVLVVLLGRGFFLGSRVWFGGSRIFLYSSFGKPTFWQRNGDKILASGITSIISAAIGFVAGYLSK